MAATRSWMHHTWLPGHVPGILMTSKQPLGPVTWTSAPICPAGKGQPLRFSLGRLTDVGIIYIQQNSIRKIKVIECTSPNWNKDFNTFNKLHFWDAFPAWRLTKQTWLLKTQEKLGDMRSCEVPAHGGILPAWQTSIKVGEQKHQNISKQAWHQLIAFKYCMKHIQIISNCEDDAFLL